MSDKKRIVVVCPGRGSYTKDNLGTLKDRPSITKDLTAIDSWRTSLGEPSISELDGAEKFKTSTHTKGEHASPLIYTCSKADFLEINCDEFEIVAVTGNSMGWYLTLAFAGALNEKDSFDLIQTMGSMMKGGLIGGQIIYPIVDENWSVDHEIKLKINELLRDINKKGGNEVYISIELGGYYVLAGNKPGLAELTKALPQKDNYPFQLVNHGAFHTPLLDEVSDKAFQVLKHLNFQKPEIPMIDGRGHIWQPHSTNTTKLSHYTLGHQVTETYDFTKAITVALKEFSPDHIVLLGPGNSLGGAIGQTMIMNRWKGIQNKSEFSELQKTQSFLVSMGMAQQKKIVSLFA